MDDDIRRMASITREAIEAGALGFTSSRTVIHRSHRENLPTPGTYADKGELLALTEAATANGKGVVGIIPSGVAGGPGGTLDEYSDPMAEAQLYADLSRRTGATITFTTLQSTVASDYWRDVLDYATEANKSDAHLRPQIAPRAVTVLHGLGSNHLFMLRPTYKKIAHLPLAERVAEMRKPEIREAILSEADSPGFTNDELNVALFRCGFQEPLLYPMGSPVDYEPSPDTSLASRIATTGSDPEELLYDTLLEDEGKAYYMALLANYVDGNLDAAGEMLVHPATVVGLSDAGAHVTFVCDASNITFSLIHWAARRTRGPRIPLEQVVAKLSSINADLYGLSDRGRIKPGLRADPNIINLDQLAVLPRSVEGGMSSSKGKKVLLTGCALAAAPIAARAHDAPSQELLDAATSCARTNTPPCSAEPQDAAQPLGWTLTTSAGVTAHDDDPDGSYQAVALARNIGRGYLRAGVMRYHGTLLQADTALPSDYFIGTIAVGGNFNNWVIDAWASYGRQDYGEISTSAGKRPSSGETGSDYYALGMDSAVSSLSRRPGI